MLILLSRWNQLARRATALEVTGEVRHAPIEIPHLSHARREFLSLLGQERAQPGGDLVAAPGGTHRSQLGSLLKRDVELAQADQQAQPLRVGAAALPVAVI